MIRKSLVPLDIAKYFLVYAANKGDLVTNKKLQKLLYYAEAWSLALHGNSLFDERIEAWVHGPVIPSVYHHYKRYGWQPLPRPRKNLEDFDFDNKTVKLLNDVMLRYGDHSADYLERLAHSERPWREARGNAPLEEYSNEVIDRDVMKSFYKSLLKPNGKGR